MVQGCDASRVDKDGFCVTCRILSSGDGRCVCLRENKDDAVTGTADAGGPGIRECMTAGSGGHGGPGGNGESDDDLGPVAMGFGGRNRGRSGGGRNGCHRGSRVIPQPEDDWDGFYRDILEGPAVEPMLTCKLKGLGGDAA